MRKLIGLMVTFVVGFALAVCGSAATPTPSPSAAWKAKWDEVLAKAKQEGTVTVWTGQGGQAVVAHLKDAFEAAYPGIKVDLFQAPSGSAFQTRFLQEWKAGVASVDVMAGSSSGGDGRLKPAGALQPIRPFWILPEITDESNWAGGYQFVDIERQYMLMGGSSSTPPLALAKDVDPSQFKKWTDLLNPAFRGKILMNDPRTTGNGAARAGYWFCAPDPKCVQPVMRKFMQQFFEGSGVVLSDDDKGNLDRINSGKMKILISPSTNELPALGEIGALPTLVRKLEAPDGKTYDQISDSDGIIYVPNKLPHPNAATVYINWFYSKAGGKAMVASRKQPSLRKDVDNSSLPDYLVPFEPAYSANQTIRLLNTDGGIRNKVNEWLPKK